MRDVKNDVTLSKVEVLFEGHSRAPRGSWKTLSETQEGMVRGRWEKENGKKERQIRG